MAAFSLEEYNSALEAFNKAGTLNPAPPANLLKTWIRKCDAELGTKIFLVFWLKIEGASGSDAKPAATPTPAPAQKSVATPTPAAKPVAPPAASSASQIRFVYLYVLANPFSDMTGFKLLPTSQSVS